MADENQRSLDAAKAKLAEGKDARAKTAEAQEAAAQGKPTPTQEENDLAKLGAHITEHEADGSAEQSPPGAPQTKQADAKKPASTYSTRSMRPEASS